MAQPAPHIVIVGSVNLDLVARVHRLPGPGETLAAHELHRVPGGKGATRRWPPAGSARGALVGAVGADAAADEALALLRADGVDLSGVSEHPRLPTGHALVTVDDAGETTIVVAAGANDAVAFEGLEQADAVLTVLEVPDAAVAAVAAQATGLFVLNAAPARPVAPEVVARADLVVSTRPSTPSWTAWTRRARWPSRSAATALCCGAAAGWSRGRRPRRPGSSTARVRATASPRRSRLHCCRAAPTPTRCATRARRGRSPWSRPGAQPALPWAEELD